MGDSRDEEVKAAIEGLLAIAKLAMPDSYYATDRRVKAAKELLNDSNCKVCGRFCLSLCDGECPDCRH